MVNMNVVDRTINFLRDQIATSDEEAEKLKKIRQLEMIKSSAVTMMAVTAIFFILIPSIMTAILSLPFLIAGKDIFNVASNFLEMVQNVRTDVIARMSRDELINQLTKNTLVAKSFINMSNLSTRQLFQIIDNFGK